MTYGIVAIILLMLGVAWYIITGRSDKRVHELETAITAGEEETFSTLLKSSPDVTDSVSDVTFLLVKSIIHNRAAMVQELLDTGHSGCEIQECAVEHDVDLLGLAIESADADVLRMLMVAGMKETAEETAPVLTCYSCGKPEHLAILKNFEATGITEKQNARGHTPLHAAAIRFSENEEQVLAMVRPLLESGADVNALSAGGNTPLDMALDRTHEGAGDTKTLVDLLLSYGARRGRSLRVPEPAYTGRLFYAAAEPTLPNVNVPDGVELVLHAGKTATINSEDIPKEYDVPRDNLDKLLRHCSYAEIIVKGKQGEDPLEVAEKALSVIATLAVGEGVLGVQFEHSLLDMSHFRNNLLVADDGHYCPLLYTTLRFGSTEDEVVLVDTAGLSRFGLQEIELIIDSKKIKKNKNEAINGLVSDLSAAVLAGASAWESGHTATIRGMFCHIGYGKHAITSNDGLVFIVLNP